MGKLTIVVKVNPSNVKSEQRVIIRNPKTSQVESIHNTSLLTTEATQIAEFVIYEPRLHGRKWQLNPQPT